MMNWKGCGRKQSWSSLSCYPRICLEGLRKTAKNLSQDSRSPGRDLNTVPPKCEGVLSTQPQCSVSNSGFKVWLAAHGKGFISLILMLMLN
jgi:hypothetical protein